MTNENETKVVMLVETRKPPMLVEVHAHADFASRPGLEIDAELAKLADPSTWPKV